MSFRTRREFLKASASASVLVALGARAQAAPAAPPRFSWSRSVCRSCGIACGVHVGTVDGRVVSLKRDAESHDAGFLCLKTLLPQLGRERDRGEVTGATDAASEPCPAGCERMGIVAGVLFLTAPGAGPRVATRLAGEPGVELIGGDGDSRIAVVWEVDGARLDELAERLAAEEPELLGVLPTFVGLDA